MKPEMNKSLYPPPSTFQLVREDHLLFVGFSNVYCELQQMCYCFVTNLSFKHKIKAMLTVISPSFLKFGILLYS
jgi:hypothetical protein